MLEASTSGWNVSAAKDVKSISLRSESSLFVSDQSVSAN